CRRSWCRMRMTSWTMRCGWKNAEWLPSLPKSTRRSAPCAMRCVPSLAVQPCATERTSLQPKHAGKTAWVGHAMRSKRYASMHDLILIGGGLANGLIAWWMKHLHPQRRLLLVEKDAMLGG